MKRGAIMSLIRSLACSQGLYGRLYRAIMDLDDDDREDLFQEWEEMDFGDDLDFILYIEGA